MKEVSQNEFLNRVETQLEQQLREVISVFQNLPNEVLHKSLTDNEWSIVECLAHLNSYADFYHPRIKKAIHNAPAITGEVLFKHTHLGKYFIKSMNATTGTRKFKAMKKHQPVNVGDPHAIVSQFIEHLENLLCAAREAKQKSLRKISITTSISSLLRINLGDAFAFLVTHNQRHLNQAKNVLAKIFVTFDDQRSFE